MIHYRIRRRYACGIGARWSSQFITSTGRRAAVTCRGCRRTNAFAEPETRG